MPPYKNPIKIGEFLKSSAAVTEVLDFVTILGILMLSFSIMGLVGYPALKNAQEMRYIENTRQSFIVMAENINKVAFGEAPSQSVEMKMYGGMLGINRGSIINITANVTNQTIVERTVLYQGPMGSIENSIGDTIVAYEGTGVWIKNPNGVISLASKPIITHQDNVLIVPIVFINGMSSLGGVGMSRIMICPDSPCSPRLLFYGNASNITITITSKYASGWEYYFKNLLELDVESSSGVVSGSLNSTKKIDIYLLDSQLYTVIK
jgi:hypothetical protein